ncbi:MAG: protein kinase [Myxococcales bacterium]|nr:protein kinase [Myxococcales bacterium]
MTILEDTFGLVGVVLEGQYRVDAVVGEGGFGVVYRGWHLAFEQPIAVKVLKVPVVDDPSVRDGVLRKFKDEARLLYTLSQVSLNVVRSIDFGAAVTPRGVWAPYMVLEWLEGQSLADDLRARRGRGLRGRSVAEALALLETAADGLAVAHERKIAHRDVKPANFFLCAGDPPRTKVLDFGIAKLMRDEDAMTPGTRSAFSSFTWLYAAPEQLDPRHGATAAWTDVYSFALVLTEVLTDRPPVEDADVMSIMRVATDVANRPTPRSRGANVPDHIEDACRKALDVDPKARFANVAELWAQLKAEPKRRASTVVQSAVVSAPPTGEPATGHAATVAVASSGAPAPLASHRGPPIPPTQASGPGGHSGAPAPMASARPGAAPPHPGHVHASPPILTGPPMHAPQHPMAPPMTGGPVGPPRIARALPQESGCTTALIVGGILAFIAALVLSTCVAGLAQAC